MKKNIAILASGSGTNAENLIKYFKKSEHISVKLVLTNKPGAYVIQRAKNHQVEVSVFTKQELASTQLVLETLKKHQVDYVILAGFLLLIPQYLVKAYPKRIINIHPALLPKYGGKGMYGDIVHQRIIDNKEKESGITIHLVNEKFDEGEILFQAKCSIDSDDTYKTLANKIHKLEYAHFPPVVKNHIMKKD